MLIYADTSTIMLMYADTHAIMLIYADICAIMLFEINRLFLIIKVVMFIVILTLKIPHQRLPIFIFQVRIQILQILSFTKRRI